MKITRTSKNLSIFGVLVLVSALIIACGPELDTAEPNTQETNVNTQETNVNKPSQSLDDTELSHTLYILVIVNQFDFICRDPMSKNDPFAFLGDVAVGCYRLKELSDVWSVSADALGSVLAEAGFRTVVTVAAETKDDRHVFSVIGQVEDIVDGTNLIRFRSILSRLFDGTVEWTPLRLNKHPLQIRADFETALAAKLVPNSRLIVLNQPKFQHVSVSCFS